MQNDVFLMQFFPKVFIIQENTLAEGSGSLVNKRNTKSVIL